MAKPGLEGRSSNPLLPSLASVSATRHPAVLRHRPRGSQPELTRGFHPRRSEALMRAVCSHRRRILGFR